MKSAGLGAVSCHTFHGFALRVCREFGNEQEARLALLSDPMQKRIVREVGLPR